MRQIDWTKPLETVDGERVRLATFDELRLGEETPENPDKDGDYWVTGAGYRWPWCCRPNGKADAGWPSVRNCK